MTRAGVRFYVKAIIEDGALNPMEFHSWARALTGRDLMPGLTLVSLSLERSEKFEEPPDVPTPAPEAPKEGGPQHDAGGDSQS